MKNLLNSVYPPDFEECIGEQAPWLAKLLPYQHRSEALTLADEQTLVEWEQKLKIYKLHLSQV